jgi:hypothetical protein
MPYSDPTQQQAYFKEYYNVHKEHKLAAAKESYVKKKDAILSYHQRRRLLVLNQYGAQCTCCGEVENKFLSMDHIDGGGSQHRKALKRAGTRFYKWLVDEGFPKGYQVLCHNCNMAKGFYGQCPHHRELVDVGYVQGIT